MKAILVIDVKNIDQVNRCRVTVCEDKAQYTIDDVKVKPIPKCRYYRGNERDFTDGFNTCVDEILGENDESNRDV